MKDERVRIMGIDILKVQQEIKSKKKFGLAAKARLKQLLGKPHT